MWTERERLGWLLRRPGWPVEAAKPDAATRLRRAERSRQITANLKELGYGG